MLSWLCLFAALAFLIGPIFAMDPFQNNSITNGKLIFAHVIYRHGDRTPIEPYPNDPWGKRDYWPTGWGQLTNMGKEQHYELGQWLRKRYSRLINMTYSLEDVYIRSTDVDRTLMSAQSDLAGLYPPNKEEIWHKNLLWQPIPVHTVPENQDIVMGKAPCDAYNRAMKLLLNSNEFKKITNRFEYLFEYLTKFSGKTINSFEALQYINNTLYIETLYDRELPEWTKKVFPSTDMTYAANFAFTIYTYTRHMARLKTGPMIKEILQRMVEKSKGKLTPNRNLWIYSGHDTTIANVLNTLKLFDIHSPPYKACILIELYMDDKNNSFVSISYKNTTADPLPMVIPGCGTLCPLDKMFKIYADILPNNWQQECELSPLLITYGDANIGVALGIMVTIITVMLFLSYISMIYYRRRNYRNYFQYSQVA